MTPAARVQAAIDVLADIAAIPRPADALLSGFFRSRRYIGAKDRAVIAARVYQVLRRHARLSWWLERNGAEPTPRSLVIADLLLGDGETATSVFPHFDGSRYGPKRLTSDEVALTHRLAGRSLETFAMPDGVRFECPAWAESLLRERFGGRFAEEMLASLEPGSLDLRINTLKTTVDQALARLAEEGVSATPTRWSPVGIRVVGRPPLATLGSFQDGWVEIQDEGSQLVAALVDARAGHQVVDFCAGAGGKTLAMGASMQNRGRIIACDVLENRLGRAAERFRRGGLHNAETRVLSSTRDTWVRRHKRKFDRVLVDAPCSGTGTWRRNPDSRWRSLGPDLEQLQELQATLLASASRLVRRGGRLIYATCSLLSAENEAQVERFLGETGTAAGFRPLPAGNVWQTLGLGLPPFTGEYFSCTPADHGTDGFFCAIFELCATV